MLKIARSVPPVHWGLGMPGGGAWGGAQGHGLNTRPSQNLQKTLPSFLISGGQAAALDTRLFDKGKKEEEEE